MITLLDAAIATGAGNPAVEQVTYGSNGAKTFQAAGATSAGVGSATVAIQVSNDGVNYLTLGTITLTLGTTATSDGFAADSKWTYTRANLTAISGTNASVSVTMGA